MQTEMTASQIQKVCSSTHLNLLLKIHQHILEISGFTFPAFSSQENQSLRMEFSLNFPEISTVSHMWKWESHRRTRGNTLHSGCVAPVYSNKVSWGGFSPS